VNKKIFAASLIASLSLSVYAADFNLGISGSDNGITGFALSVGEYYKAPAEEVRIVRRALPSDELSVVYYLARKSHKNPEYITKMRTNGRSWWDIAIALRLDPQVVYVAEAPRGKVYGHYKNKKHNRLGDRDVVEIVNTRFLSSYHGVSADEIYDRRQSGRGYDGIDDDYRGKKHKKEKGSKGDRDDNDRPGKGHGHGRD
jgi:hypothetical protein